MEFKVNKANIAEVSADAVVLPANERLKETAGVSGDVFKAAGRKKLQQTCDEIGYCGVGGAVPTLAYGLDANYIIHAVIPTWTDGNHGEYDLLARAYLSALKSADIMGCESLAIPLLASEREGFDRERAITLAIKSIEGFFGKNLKKIALIIRENQTENDTRISGYTILTYTKENGTNRKTVDHREKTKIMIGSTKKITRSFLTDQAKKAGAWFLAKENRGKIIQCVIRTAAVLCNKKSDNTR